MAIKFYSENTTRASSFRLMRTGVDTRREKSDPFTLFHSPQSSKQKLGRSNRKVIFVSSGERPFRISKNRFTMPIRYALYKGNPNSQYPSRIVEDNDAAYWQYFDSRKQEFLHKLTTTDFYNGETDEIETMTAELIKRRKFVFLNWIQQLFLDNIGEVDVEVGILDLMRLFTYDELAPASQMIALAARDMADDRIKDAAFSLFGHWCDERALKLLEAYDMPDDPWMAMKYETLIKDIKQYAVR